jgi:hypothetical protein
MIIMQFEKQFWHFLYDCLSSFTHMYKVLTHVSSFTHMYMVLTHVSSFTHMYKVLTHVSSFTHMYKVLTHVSSFTHMYKVLTHVSSFTHMYKVLIVTCVFLYTYVQGSYTCIILCTYVQSSYTCVFLHSMKPSVEWMWALDLFCYSSLEDRTFIKQLIATQQRVVVMVFNATFNTISVISWWSVYWWREPEYPEKITDL